MPNFRIIQIQIIFNHRGLLIAFFLFQVEGKSNQLQSISTSDTKSLPQNVVPLDQYIPYYTSPQLSYEPYYPKQERKLQEKIPAKALDEYLENVNNDPKQVIANLKKNSDIPDVPPPPLPVRNL